MREFKFRIWYKGNPKFGPKFRPMMIIEDGEEYHIDFNILRKDENVRMQWTGIKDRDGKDIYEGDLVKVKPALLGLDTSVLYMNKSQLDHRKDKKPLPRVMQEYFLREVKFEEKEGGFNLAKYMGDSPTFKVVGNVFENPELVKELG